MELERTDIMRNKFIPMVLPEVYENILSHEEHLRFVLQKINELGEYINESLEDVDSLVKENVDKALVKLEEYTRKEVKELKELIIKYSNDFQEEFDSLSNEFGELYKELTESQKEFTEYLNNKIKVIENEMVNLEIRLNARVYKSLKDSNRYTDIQIKTEELKRIQSISKLQMEIDNLKFSLPRMYNPCRGYDTSIQNCILDLYNRLSVHGLTCIEQDSLELTAEEFDNMNITSLEYDTESDKLVSSDKVFSPFTGKKVPLVKVVYDIVNYLQFNGKSVGEFDSMDVSAEMFDSSAFNAYDMDSNKYYNSVNETSVDISHRNKKYENVSTLYINDTPTEEQSTIDIQSSNSLFDRIRIVFRNPSGGEESVEFVYNEVEPGVELYSQVVSDNVVMYSRHIDILDNSIHTSECNACNITTNDSYTANGKLVILAVYGINSIKDIKQ